MAYIKTKTGSFHSLINRKLKLIEDKFIKKL